MALTNYERVGKALDLLKTGLLPFVEREMKAKFGANWRQQAQQAVGDVYNWQAAGKNLNLDSQALLALLLSEWQEVFGKVLGPAHRNLVHELRGVRNAWAHQNAFSTDDADRALDSTVRLLRAVSAPEADEADRMRKELLALRFQQMARQPVRRAAPASAEGSTLPGLKPWREIVAPHPDVSSGRYIQAEFAADLDQVHLGKAEDEYQDPRQFFQRTYLTSGLLELLAGAAKRLSGGGGDPIIELQTNFGGGKTHSLLAAYHLFSGASAKELSGVEAVLQAAGVTDLPKAHRAVLVGTALSPAQPWRKPGGLEIRTLWGELAWQLGGPDGYSLVAEADRASTNPGSRLLSDLIGLFSPCLILIDEWVAFVRQLKSDSSAGTFDSNLTFAQSLSEAVRSTPRALLLASLPQSRIEQGGEAGVYALEQLKHSFGRMESSWRPANAQESFEIVRRRLFQPLTDPKLEAERKAVVQAFARLYREHASEFPPDAGKASYEQELEAAYPIHPELFHRLYDDWSTLDRFQRTRGVLRLMATVIRDLWESGDAGLLILPGLVPLDDPRAREELTRYLDEPWVPVIDKDVDGERSVPADVDRSQQGLGRYQACRRVARTLFMATAPMHGTNQRGIDDRSVKLGCAQPGESIATYGDALRKLVDRATHLYADQSGRYWFSTQPSVRREAEDRAAHIARDDVLEEIRRRLRADRDRGDFTAVHRAPASPADVDDEQSARLVILAPEFTHSSRDRASAGMREAQRILNERGSGPRRYRNMLLFVAADVARLADLEDGVRLLLAWQSIVRDQDALNLDAYSRALAAKSCGDWEQTVGNRLRDTYDWLLAPSKADPRPETPETWQDLRLPADGSIALRASRKAAKELLLSEFSGVNLRFELDKVWQGRDHVKVKDLWDWFCQYLYLPRLRDRNLFTRAIQEGAGQLSWHDMFAYAQAYSESDGRYLGLRPGEIPQVVIDDHSVIVRPEAAQRQLDQDNAASGGFGAFSQGLAVEPAVPHLSVMNGATSTYRADVEPNQPAAAPAKPRRFHGTVALRPKFVTGDAGKVADEVIQHLTSLLGADVEVTLEIQATVPDGVPDNVVRIVSENCRTLKFTSQGFEEE